MYVQYVYIIMQINLSLILIMYVLKGYMPFRAKFKLCVIILRLLNCIILYIDQPKIGRKHEAFFLFPRKHNPTTHA